MTTPTELRALADEGDPISRDQMLDRIRVLEKALRAAADAMETSQSDSCPPRGSGTGVGTLGSLPTVSPTTAPDRDGLTQVIFDVWAKANECKLSLEDAHLSGETYFDETADAILTYLAQRQER